MNHQYFACRDCFRCIEAGYRWAASTLKKTGLVTAGSPVDVSSVLSAEEYWRGEQEAEWLAEALPPIREFLLAHRDHHVVFGHDESFQDVADDEYAHLDWLYEENPKDSVNGSPPLFLRVGLRSWEDVEKYVAESKEEPWWWDDAPTRHEARRRFDVLRSRYVDASGSRGERSVAPPNNTTE